jgi:hypothetical protein
MLSVSSEGRHKVATWIAAIVASGGRPDFWDVLQTHGVHPVQPTVPEHALIDCGAASQFRASIDLAAALSRELRTDSIGFFAQTSADVYEIEAFEDGRRVRRLAYSRDYGGWLEVLGAPQKWEPAFFFGDRAETPHVEHPEMLSEEVSEDDVVRYEQARRTGDPGPVIDLLHPSSLAPLYRLCRHFDTDPRHAVATWRRASLWSRVLSTLRR